MTRIERTRLAATRLEIRSCAQKVRALSMNPFGFGVELRIRAAGKSWKKAKQMLLMLADRETAAQRERKKKLERDWWKKSLLSDKGKSRKENQP